MTDDMEKSLSTCRSDPPGAVDRLNMLTSTSRKVSRRMNGGSDEDEDAFFSDAGMPVIKSAEDLLYNAQSDQEIRKLIASKNKSDRLS